MRMTYGAAASIVVILIWVYYTAQLVLMGAEFTNVYARRWGSKRGETFSTSPWTRWRWSRQRKAGKCCREDRCGYGRDLGRDWPLAERPRTSLEQLARGLGRHAEKDRRAC